MTRPAPRIHRLPHRLDYTLIPAPLDLSLPLATEKSNLPAIIVTPSSPSSAHDFSIAFLAPQPKPSLADRFSTLASFEPPALLRARTVIIMLLTLFIVLCHVVTHHLAAQPSHLEFSVETQASRVVNPWIAWFGFHTAQLNPPDTNGVLSHLNH